MSEILKNIAKIAAGNSAPNKDDFSETGIPFIRAGSLEFLVRGVPIDECEMVDPILAKEKKLRLFSKGSILFAKSGMSSKMGRIYILPRDAYVVSHLAVITVTDANTNNQYIAYYFKYRPPFNLIKDDAYPSISLADIENVEVPLPDLETQNKIVAILNKAKAMLDKREEAIRKYDELLRATFFDMFGDPFKPKNNTFVQLNAVVTEINSGWSPVCEEKPRISSDQIAILKQGAVSRRYFIPEENKIFPNKLPIKKAVYAKHNDLLFSRKNTPELVGATAYLFEDYENLLLPDTIFNIRYDRSKVSGVYLFYLFNNVEFRKKIHRLSVGQAESMSNISQERLLKLEIPYPDMDDQRVFENIVVKSYDKTFKKFKKSKIEIDRLLKNLSQQVFSERITIDVDAELEALVNAIDLEGEDEENKIDTVVNDITFVQRLMDKLRDHEFENKDQYDKASYILLRIMKEEEGLVKQIFKNDEIQITLLNETA